MIDRVAKTEGETWHNVLEFGIIEFFNVLCFCKDRDEEDRKKIEEFKRKH